MGYASTLLTDSWSGITNFFDPQKTGYSSSQAGAQFDESGNYTGTVQQSSGGTDTSKLSSNLSLFTQIAGGINSAIGGYYAAKSSQYQAKSQAVQLRYQSDMAAINARQSEYKAESDIKAGQSQIFNYTMQEGQQASATKANMAARGLRAGIGTTQDVVASQEIVKDVNVYNINTNAVRAASADREQATNYRNESMVDSVGAANADRTAGSISPFASGYSSLLTSASQIAGNWNSSQRMKQYLANGGYMGSGMGGFN